MTLNGTMRKRDCSVGITLSVLLWIIWNEGHKTIDTGTWSPPSNFLEIAKYPPRIIIIQSLSIESTIISFKKFRDLNDFNVEAGSGGNAKLNQTHTFYKLSDTLVPKHVLKYSSPAMHPALATTEHKITTNTSRI